jgi:catalase
MRVDGNGESNPNYFPNSFDNIYADENYKEQPMVLDSNIADWYNRNAEGEDGPYTLPGILFSKVMTEQEKKNTIKNIVSSMSGISGPKKDEIVNCQLCHFFLPNVEFGLGIADGLGVKLDGSMLVHESK